MKRQNDGCPEHTENRKLALARRTVRALTPAQLGEIAGGYSRVVPPSFTLSCGC